MFFCSFSFYLVQFFYTEFFNIFRSPVIRKGQEEGENSVSEEGQCGKKIEELETFLYFKDSLRVSRKITQENAESFMVWLPLHIFCVLRIELEAILETL